MKKLTANDGTFLISLVKTKEGRNIAFCFAWESAVDDISNKIIATFPNYFEAEEANIIWMKSEADNNISINELMSAAAIDSTDAIVLLDFDTKKVISGVQNWLDINSLIELTSKS